ncbi:hypothetical protein H0H81_005788 [Sphagnurus paluster]|uniref:Uncharacterized protein n=1 Tax=Sphagnurus paluster TaxID=117069 RepID=A0A9P7KIZ3_9AGAR|nr:hypothetical protein H0H81_005788 [Sphagnurus paluster]
MKQIYKALTYLCPFEGWQPCDENGYDLPPNTPPPPPTLKSSEDYSPYGSETEFKLADFLYRKEQMSGTKITELMDIWAAHNASLPTDDCGTPPPPPFASASDLYNTIDSTELGDIPWQAFSVKYNGKLPQDGPIPTWMTKSYEVWFRDPLKVMESQIGNPDFVGEMDYAAKQVYGPDGQRIYGDTMSGNWPWEQSVRVPAQPKDY